MPLLALNSHLGVRRIADTLTFYAETTSATGAALDADAVPGYRIYEEETGTAIVTGGVMALLDSANTAGLYSEQITLASATGYEFNKEYVIYITATIAGIAAAAIYTFRMGPEGALYSGLASAGAAGTVTLTTTPATNDILNGTTVAIIGGTGVGQSRVISDYTSGLVASVIPNWITNPDSTSVFAIYPYGQANVQQWRDVQPNALSSGRVDANVTAMAAGVITATVIATDAIDADAMAANAIDAAVIATGAITAAKFAAGAIDAAAIADGAIDAATLATGTITAAKFAAGAIDAAAIANGAIDAATFAAGAIDAAAIANGAIDAATFAAGAIDAAAIATDAITAAKIAADAIGASELAAGAATEIGTAVWAEATRTLSAGAITTATFAAGAIDAAAIAADAIGSSELAASAVTEIQTGLATAAALATVQADTDDIQTRLPAALSGGGYIRAQVYGMEASTITAAAIATSAIDADALAADAAAEIAAAVWEEPISNHKAAGTFGQANNSLHSGTAQAGAATTITLAAGASAIDDFYNNAVILLSAGTGADQIRTITDYNGTTKVATVTTWGTNPDATTIYVVLPVIGAIAGGTAPTAAEVADAVWDEARAGHVAGGSFGEYTPADTVRISGDSAAADSLETMLDGTGGNVLTLGQLRLSSSAAGGAIDIDNSAGPAIVATAGGAASHGVLIEGAGSGDGIRAVAGATGHGVHGVGGATSGQGANLEAVGGGHGFRILGVGSGLGVSIQGGTTAHAVELVGGATGDRVGVSFVPSGNAPPVSGNLGYIRTGTAQAGGASTITLDAGATATDDYFNGALVFLPSGTGAGQGRIITDYVGATKVATVSPAWATNPDATSTFSLMAANSVTTLLASGAITSATFAAGAIDAAAIAADAIGSSELAASAVTEIQTGLATAAALAVVQADTDDIQARLPAALVGGRIDASVGAMAANVITAAAIATGAIDADAIAADAIGASELAADAITEIQSGLATAAALATVQSDTDNIQTRLPAALVGGRMDSSVGALAADVITAASIAAGAIDAATFAAGAIDAAAIADGAIDAATFAAGAINAAAIAADAIGASELAADAVTEIQAGLATAAALATVQADTDNIQTRLPAALVSGRMDSSVGAMAADVITAASIATAAIDADAIAADAIGSSELAASAVSKIADQVWEEAIADHSGTVGSTAEALAAASAGGSPGAIADAVWDELASGHVVSGSFGQAQNIIRAGTAQAGAASTITLDAGASAANNFYNNQLLVITGGSGAGQARTITDYDGTTKVANVSPIWVTTPSATSVFVILPQNTDTTLQAGAVWEELRASHFTSGTFGEGIAVAASGIAAASFISGAITADAIAPDAIGSSELAASAVTEIQTGLATSAALATVQADTDDIQARLPATLVGGRMRSHVEAFDAAVITAAAIAPDAIGASELAADAVTEIQAGLATSAALATAQSDLDDIQTRLPAALVSGRMDSSVGAMAAGVVTAAAVATGAIDADALATDAVNEIVDQTWREAIADHSGVAGSTAEALAAAATGGSPGAIADAVWDEARAGHTTAGTFGEGVASVQGNVTGSVGSVAAGGISSASFAAGAITAAAIAADAIGASELAADAVTEIQAGLATAAALAVVQADTDNIQTRLPAALVGGRIDASVGAMAADVITAASIAPDAIGSSELAASAVAEIADQVWEEAIADHSGTVGSTAEALAAAAAGGSPGAIANAVWDELTSEARTAGSYGQLIKDDIDATISSRASSAQAVSIQADTDNIQTRLPAALVGGRMDSSVGAMEAGTITAAAIATGAIDADAIAADAIGASELAADAVAEIQAGLATAAALATVQADTDDIQTRLPATLVGGRMRSHIEALDAAVITAASIAPDAIGASELAADAVAEIQAGLATSAALATVQADTDDIQARLPATLNGGRMRSHVEALDAATITAAVIATGAIDADALATDAVAEIADGVWDEIASGHVTSGSFGQAQNLIRAGTAQAAGASTITLDAGASASDDFYNNTLIHVTGGTGAGQSRMISDYVGATKVATVNSAWVTTPDATSVFVILPFGSIPGVTAPSAADVADAVWDEARAAHTAVGSFGEGVASVQGNVTGSVASVAAGGITAASIATDAIDSDAIAASAVTEIQTGLATSAALATVQADTDDIQARLPATLNGGRMRSHVEALDADVITAASIAADAIGSSELAASAVTEIQTGLATSAALATVQADTDDIQTRLPAALVGGRMDASVGAMAANVLTASALATDAVDEIVDQTWNELIAGHLGAGSTGEALNNAGSGASTSAIANAVWDELTAEARAVGSYGQLVKDDLDATISSRASAAQATAIQADTDDIQARLPATLVGGRMRSHIEALDAAVITAASIAPDAIGASELAADAVAEIQSGLATAAALATVQADTDDIQARLPATLSGGRMRSQVEGMDAGTVTAAAVATGAIDADALATDAVNEIVDQTWDEVLAGHLTAGSTGAALNAAGAGGDPSVIADAVWDEARAGHVAAGSFGEGVASVQGNVTGSVGSVAAGGIAAASFVAGAINAAAIAADAIGASELAADAVAEIQAGLATAAALATVQADTDDIQTRLPAALVSGRMDSSVGAMAADVITAAAIAADAIGSSELAASAVTEIQAGLATSAALAVVQADTDDIQTRLPAALVGGRMDSSVGSMAAGVVTAAAVATGAIDADALAADAVAEIADGVWDEDIVAAHGTADTAGETVSQLTKRAATLATEVLDGSIIGQMLDDGTAVYDRTTDSLQAIRDSIATAGPSAAVIADAVWDEAIAGHLTAGSTGEALSNAGAAGVPPTVSQIADGVWDELIAGHLGVGSTGEALDNAGSGASPAVIAAAVWDEAIAGHLAVGSTGEALDQSRDAAVSVDGKLTPGRAANLDNIDVLVSSRSTLTASQAADQVWDEQLGDHLGAGSTGEALDAINDKLTPSRAANLDNLDVLVSSRSTLTAAQAADQVWDEQLGDHLNAGSTGEALDAITVVAGSTPAQVAMAVWDESKAAHQGDTIMGNIAQDSDNREFAGEEG